MAKKILTLADRARKAGLNPKTVFSRVYTRGWSIRRALATPIGKGLTLSDRAREAGLNPNTVFDRVNKHGWSISRALATPKRSCSISAAARAAGIKPSLVFHRLARGWTLEKSLIGPRPTTRSELARQAGINPGTVNSRLRQGWPIERALATPADDRQPKSTSPRARQARVRCARNKEMAAMLLGRSVGEQAAAKLVHDLRLLNITSTVRDSVRRAGHVVSYSVAYRRVKMGWPTETAVSIPPLRKRYSRYRDGDQHAN
jgi:lambda repressor-like predicted transcriptional regulator